MDLQRMFTVGNTAEFRYNNKVRRGRVETVAANYVRLEVNDGERQYKSFNYDRIDPTYPIIGDGDILTGS